MFTNFLLCGFSELLGLQEYYWYVVRFLATGHDCICDVKGCSNCP